MKKIAGICALLLLAGCGSHPKVLTFTPASVVIDYSGNDLHQATSLAQQYCSSINKDAQYVRSDTTFLAGKAEAFFNCVEHNRNRNDGGSGSNSNSNQPIINNFK